MAIIFTIAVSVQETFVQLAVMILELGYKGGLRSMLKTKKRNWCFKGDTLSTYVITGILQVCQKY